MDTMLAIQDSPFNGSVSAGKQSSGTSSGLFSSTLLKEMHEPDTDDKIASESGEAEGSSTIDATSGGKKLTVLSQLSGKGLPPGIETEESIDIEEFDETAYNISAESLNPMPEEETHEAISTGLVPEQIIETDIVISEQTQVQIPVAAEPAVPELIATKLGEAVHEAVITQANTESAELDGRIAGTEVGRLQSIINNLGKLHKVAGESAHSSQTSGSSQVSDSGKDSSPWLLKSATADAGNQSGASFRQASETVSSELKLTSASPEGDIVFKGLVLDHASPQIDPALLTDIEGNTPDINIQALSNPASLQDSTEISEAEQSKLPVLQMQSELEAGSDEWSQDIGTKIAWLSNQKIGKAEISLHPAELGALDITINTDDDRITVSIVTRNESSRELLENSLPRLNELLRNNGLSLAESNVSHQSHSDDKTGADGTNENTSQLVGEGDETAEPVMRRSTIEHQGQVDHYV